MFKAACKRDVREREMEYCNIRYYQKNVQLGAVREFLNGCPNILMLRYIMPEGLK